MYRYVIPPRAVPRADDRYFEVLSQSVFQAGFSWEVVRRKWPAMRRAFAGFDVDAVARFRTRDVERLMRNAAVVRNRRKIEAVIENARILQEIRREHGSVRRYIRTLPRSYAQRVQILSRTFRFLGPTGVFHFLWCVGEPVPSWRDRDPTRRR
ncbi:MAG: DNA-3-methyladenine glycosylase I [Armatimonadota bacterium]|nr:DNA-3-methyladenine glycosylase I [Armatimonadota bacterium]MDR5697397.1 DNA-3-methyladenine glycosylase I [Armatimonadota bacterium]